MWNMSKMLKQAAAFQKNLQAIQEKLASETVTFTSGGGAVTAVARADGTLVSIKIDPKAVNPAEVELLEDLVLAAVDGALKAAREKAATLMGEWTSGFPPM